MCKFITTLFILIATACVALGGSSCGENLTWNYSRGKLTISGTGKMEEFMTSAPWDDSVDDITSVVIEDGVTTIGSIAFKGCTSLETVTWGNTLQTIGRSAFEGCSELNSVSIPVSVKEIKSKAFYGCSSLKSVTFENGGVNLEKMGSGVFFGCNSLKSISIPSGVKEIENQAFYQCAKMESVTLAYGIETISGSAFEKCAKLSEVSIPGSVSFIGDRAFTDCPLLKMVIYRGMTDPAGTSSPFGGSTDVELACVSRDYKGRNFNFWRVEDYIHSDAPELGPVIAQHNHCFEAMICNETYGFALERENATMWNNKAANDCGSYSCGNETGAVLTSSCDSPKVCHMKYGNEVKCEAKEKLPNKGWRVVLEFNVPTTNFNEDELLSSIQEVTKMSDSSLEFASEISSDGSFKQLSIYVANETVAKSMKTELQKVIEKASCSYDVLCKCGTIKIMENSTPAGSSSGKGSGSGSQSGSKPVDASYHNHESMFMLVLAVMVSIYFL